LINVDPMLFIGQISERDVGKVAVGNGATVETVIGDKVDGTIRYISPAADPETRTFRVEIQIPNTDHTIRDGLTASARIPLPAGKAHLMTSGVLVLNDAGELGVRTVGPQNDVAFQPIKILADAGSDGIWVSGLPLEVTIITVGQDYVTDGQKIQPILQSADAGQ
jgi:multidrug efflux system membrane fusion protein